MVFCYYDDMVEQILKVPFLKQYVQNEEAKGRFLNLISPDWRQRLTNYEVYQKHVNDAHGQLFCSMTKKNLYDKQLIERQSDKLYLMLAFPCRVSTSFFTNKPCFSVYSKNSEPLSMVAKVLTSDKEKEYTLVHDFRLLAQTCYSRRCVACTAAHQMCTEGDFNTINPCIQKTWMYNGNEIASCFASTIEDTFRNDFFMTIMQVEIDMRAMYRHNTRNLNVSRIGGNILKMIAMDTQLLMTEECLPPIISNVNSAISQVPHDQTGKRIDQDEQLEIKNVKNEPQKCKKEKIEQMKTEEQVQKRKHSEDHDEKKKRKIDASEPVPKVKKDFKDFYHHEEDENVDFYTAVDNFYKREQAAYA